MSLILGLTRQLKSLGAEEVNMGVNLTRSLLLNTFRLLSSSSSYNDKTNKKTKSNPL